MSKNIIYMTRFPGHPPRGMSGSPISPYNLPQGRRGHLSTQASASQRAHASSSPNGPQHKTSHFIAQLPPVSMVPSGPRYMYVQSPPPQATLIMGQVEELRNRKHK